MPSIDEKNIGYAALIVTGLFFYFYSGMYKIFFKGFDIFGGDFTRGCYAAQNYFSGRPLYEMPPFVNQFGYSPPITFIFMPFAKLSGPAAKTLWLVVGYILTGMCFWTVYGYGKKGGKIISAAVSLKEAV